MSSCQEYSCLLRELYTARTSQLPTICKDITLMIIYLTIGEK